MSWPLAAFGAGGAPGGLEIQITGISAAGSVSLDMVSSAGENPRVWEQGNTWGAGRWRVLVIRGGHVETYFQNPGQVFTINVPSYKEIARGGRFAQELNLNGGNWCVVGHCSRWDQHGIAGQEITFKSGDMLIVVYDVPPSVEARDMGVWFGVTSATMTVP
jgi:hypothetical protein